MLYEVWTLGMIPYHLIADDEQVARRVTQGERLSQLNNCPHQLYACDCHLLPVLLPPILREGETLGEEGEGDNKTRAMQSPS